MGLPDGCFEGAVGGAILGTTTTVMLAATGEMRLLEHGEKLGAERPGFDVVLPPWSP